MTTPQLEKPKAATMERSSIDSVQIEALYDFLTGDERKRKRQKFAYAPAPAARQPGFQPGWGGRAAQNAHRSKHERGMNAAANYNRIPSRNPHYPDRGGRYHVNTGGGGRGYRRGGFNQQYRKQQIPPKRHYSQVY